MITSQPAGVLVVVFDKNENLKHFLIFIVIYSNLIDTKMFLNITFEKLLNIYVIIFNSQITFNLF